mgnify:CR=1 FL=1
MRNLATRHKPIYSQSQQDGRSLIERSVSFLLLGLICIFALNSIGNVQQYVGLYHHHWTGNVLGIAFGTVVFVCAYIAATTSGQTRWVAISIGAIFGVASAYFQTELYMSEGMKASTAHSLSYIPILAGEVGLALLESLYSKQCKPQGVVANVTALPAALPAKTVAELPTGKAALSVALPAAGTLVLTQPNGHVPASAALPQRSGDLDAANEVRTALKQQRKAAIQQVLAAAERALTTGELVEALKAAYGWEVSSDSVRRYCQELVVERILECTGRKWQRQGESSVQN